MYEKEVVETSHTILIMLKEYPNYDEIECFYIALSALVTIHNNRFVYSNNIFDSFQTSFKGITLNFPENNDNNSLLKSSIEEYIKYFTKKIN